MTMPTNIAAAHPAVVAIANTLADAGFQLWFVGGCVRDTLAGNTPKDIDLCTTATPDEQIAVYKAAGYSYHETGLQHGTLTVVMDGEPYEITTLRTESAHDGRYAEMAWTTDLNADLARRDLTINAMACDMSGQLVDPFGGAKDLDNGIVRFVGDANARITEDYLRILRFFRFHARFAKSASIDQATFDAIKAHSRGLDGISVERVWMEMSKIISGPNTVRTMSTIQETIANVIMMPRGDIARLKEVLANGVRNPAMLMAAYLGEDVATLAENWKWSKAEIIAANYALTFPRAELKPLRYLLVDGAPIDIISELAAQAGLDRKLVEDWTIPVFPVSGNDLKDIVEPGPAMGTLLRQLKAMWAATDYVFSKEQLLSKA